MATPSAQDIAKTFGRLAPLDLGGVWTPCWARA